MNTFKVTFLSWCFTQIIQCSLCFTVPVRALQDSSVFFKALLHWTRKEKKPLTCIELNEDMYIENLKMVLAEMSQTNESFQTPRLVTDNLDFLFDTILVCNKYAMEEQEKLYSDMFVDILRSVAVDLQVSDVIPPLRSNNARPMFAQQMEKYYLSPLQMARTAKLFYLDYLASKLDDFVAEKRSIRMNYWRSVYNFY